MLNWTSKTIQISELKEYEHNPRRMGLLQDKLKPQKFLILLIESIFLKKKSAKIC